MSSRKEQETWVNASAGRVQVRKYNAKGLLGAELVGPGKNVYLTPEEREINQEAAASPELDVFANGLLQPVKLLDEASEIVVSPNHISETEMRELFSAHWKTFDAKVGEITNPSTLERLLAMADEVDAKVRQVETIKGRIDELNPLDVAEVAGGSPADAGLRSGLKAVTPR